MGGLGRGHGRHQIAALQIANEVRRTSRVSRTSDHVQPYCFAGIRYPGRTVALRVHVISRAFLEILPPFLVNNFLISYTLDSFSTRTRELYFATPGFDRNHQ